MCVCCARRIDSDPCARRPPLLTPQGRVLCVAEGEGPNSAWLARQGFQVDAFAMADSDGLAATFVRLAHPAMRSRLFERIGSSLKPGGVPILQGCTPKRLECRARR